MDFLLSIWNLFKEISPYLILGFIISGFLSVYLTVDTIKKYLGGDSYLSIFTATIFGIPLPLCSCGVIPVSAYLRKHGASKGATASFLISTPQTGVDSIFITYGLLGPVLAIYRPIVALFSGVLGGVLIKNFDQNLEDSNSLECEDDCCDDLESQSKVVKALKYGFERLPVDIVSPLLIGLFISALAGILIPSNYFELYGSGIVGMIIMLFLGLPTYICATASVPIAYMLYMKGFSLGAVLVFLMSGPATNATTISVCWKILGKKSTIIYLLSIIISSIIGGLLLDYFIPNVVLVNSSNDLAGHWIGANFEILCAILLAVVMMNALKIKYFKNEIQNSNSSVHQVIFVDGMTCSHCEESVNKTLLKIDGVDSVNANAKDGVVNFSGKNYSIDEIKKNILDLGFKINE